MFLTDKNNIKEVLLFPAMKPDAQGGAAKPDAPGAGVPSKEQLTAEAKAHFEQADKNGDGNLTKQEIKKYMSSAGADLKEHFGVKNGGWQALWNEMDADGDGSMSIQEWTALYVSKMGECPHGGHPVK